MGTRCDSSPAAAGVAPSRGSLAAGVLAAQLSSRRLCIGNAARFLEKRLKLGLIGVVVHVAAVEHLHGELAPGALVEPSETL